MRARIALTVVQGWKMGSVKQKVYKLPTIAQKESCNIHNFGIININVINGFAYIVWDEFPCAISLVVIIQHISSVCNGS